MGRTAILCRPTPTLLRQQTAPVPEMHSPRTLMAAICKGHPLEEALTWAPINSMSVVQHVGSQAGLLTEQEVKQLAPTGTRQLLGQQVVRRNAFPHAPPEVFHCASGPPPRRCPRVLHGAAATAA